LLGHAGGGFRRAPVVLVRPGRVAGLLQQVRPYGQQPVMPGHPLVAVQSGEQSQPGQQAFGLGQRDRPVEVTIGLGAIRSRIR